MKDKKSIALFGNQNAGKTTLFNALTGANQYVGNWPGVTVERVNGTISKNGWTIEDLPGLYSLSPYSPEEIVSRDFLSNGKYDVIVNIVDASHLNRSLLLTLQLMSFRRPMVIALNMMDKVRDSKIEIDIAKLSDLLGVKVVPISASKGDGIDDLLQAIENDAKVPTLTPFPEDIIEQAKTLKTELKLDFEDNVNDFIALSLLQYDKQYQDLYVNDEASNIAISKARANIESKYNLDTESLMAKMSYNFIDALLGQTVKRNVSIKKSISKKIDDIVTNKFLAIPIFVAVVYLVYYLAVSTIGTMGTDYANDVIFGEYATEAASSILESSNAPEWLSGLIIDGIIGGVGAVLGFVPQMIVLFTLLSLLEQCGYMTRVAFVLDRIFRHFGLSGRCFIPMVVATGCAVPALMTSKSIENINERRLTLITTSFIPCSAKLPILAMIAAAFFPDSTFVAPGIYLLAILSIVVTAFILKKGDAFNEDVSPFVMELPDYSLPTARNIIRSVYLRCKAFVTKAGTIIFSTVVLIWFLSSFNFTDAGLSMVDVDSSILAAIGSAVAFIFIPLGFATWHSAVAVVTGLLAKENVVGTMAVLVGLADAAEDDASLGQALHGEFATNAAALAFLAFNLFSTPCIAALGAMKREMGNGKLFGFAVLYMTAWAYGLAYVTYHVGGLIFGEVALSMNTIIALAICAFVIYLVVRPRRAQTSLKIKAKVI